MVPGATRSAITVSTQASPADPSGRLAKPMNTALPATKQDQE
jgi:hypothetical protein